MPKSHIMSIDLHQSLVLHAADRKIRLYAKVSHYEYWFASEFGFTYSGAPVNNVKERSASSFERFIPGGKANYMLR